jgi:hypothetical protein
MVDNTFHICGCEELIERNPIIIARENELGFSPPLCLGALVRIRVNI